MSPNVTVIAPRNLTYARLNDMDSVGHEEGTVEGATEVRDSQEQMTHRCSVERNFEFITETPSQGFRPKQRFNIRSHVVKQYKQSQRELQQAQSSQAYLPTKVLQDANTESGWGACNHNSETFKFDSSSQFDPLGVSQPQEPRFILELVSRPRAPGPARTPLARRSPTDSSTSTRRSVNNALGPYCQCCGAFQGRGLDSFEDQGIKISSRSTFDFRLLQSLLGPIEPLGAGRVDPFQCYPVDLESPYLQELMDHTITYLLPGLVPDITDTAVHPVSKAWLSYGLEHPLLFHAMLFAGSIHLDFLYTSQIYPDKPLTLQHKLLVIQEVNNCLNDPDVASRDEVILAILILASHEAMQTSAGEENPFNSPLREIQWLYIYSTIIYVQEHMEAVLHLVALRGGLENIKMFGLAEVIAAGDVVSATNSLSRPYCPLLRSSEAWLDYVESWAIASTQSSVQGLAQRVSELQGYGLSATIINIFKLLGAITMAIDHYLRGEPAGLTLGAIAKVRTAGQHRILSLPLSIELQDEVLFDPHIYEACCTTLLIYGIAVIFPISNAYNVLHQLVRRLKASLMCFELQNYDENITDFHLWMLVLGGIAASDGPDRTWFIAELGHFTRTQCFYDLESVEQVLRQFLWLGSACDSGARLLWSEVGRSTQA